MIPKRAPKMPKRRRVAADRPERTIRIGHAIWRARLAAPGELPGAPPSGRERVCLEAPDGTRRWATLAEGEFERISNYRLRSVIMSLADEDTSASVA